MKTRNEDEMYALILETAEADERVRAVLLNGSRANPKARRDPFQDYDIVYVVSECASFRAAPAWIDCFGERMIMQTPDEMGDDIAGPDDRYAYLIQFMDGNRLDLTLYPLAKLADLEPDSQSILLLDKDGIFEPLAVPSDADYLPQPPTARQFHEVCNEFWWVSTYVAKGLWRRELPYARELFEDTVRHMLQKMLIWHIGVATEFTVSPGKAGKYFERLLPPELWAAYLKTNSDGDYQNSWDALLTMGDLFRQVALTVADHFNFSYPHDDDARVTAYLKHVRDLPKDAPTIYG